MESLLRQMCDGYYVGLKFGPTTHLKLVNNEYGVNSMVKMAMAYYNEKEEKNFNLKKVEKLNIISDYYCMTFWAQDNRSYECHLFRGVVYVAGGCKTLLCEIKVDGKIDLQADVIELNKIDKYKPSYACENYLGASLAIGSCVANPISPIGKPLDICDYNSDTWKRNMFELKLKMAISKQQKMNMIELSYLHKTHADINDPCVNLDCGMTTAVGVNLLDCAKKYAEDALNSYNKREQTSFNLVKVEKLNNISTACYTLTFWGREGSNGECRLFRGVVQFTSTDKKK